MNNQQKQFQLTHTTHTNTLNEIVQKAMGMHIEQITRINRGQSNEVYFIDLKDGSFVLRIAKGFDYDIFATVSACRFEFIVFDSQAYSVIPSHARTSQ